MIIGVITFVIFDENSHFVTRVAQRRHLLDLAVLFYTHLAEVTSWLESLRRDLLDNMNLNKGAPKLEESQVHWHLNDNNNHNTNLNEMK